MLDAHGLCDASLVPEEAFARRVRELREAMASGPASFDG